MKKLALSFILSLFLITLTGNAFAWGKRGHELVAQIAFHFLSDSVQNKVKHYLGNLSIEEAANWMDEERSNSYYNYMRTWHYMDVDKGQVYRPTAERNIITVLYSAVNDLKNIANMDKKEIKRDLLLIFHLVGDLHQPLHVGYAVDKGGNTINVSSAGFSSNLHSTWDTEIIENKSIQITDCISLTNNMTAADIQKIKQIQVMDWMNQSRSNLEAVYNFGTNNFLDQNYVDNGAAIIKKQLLLGGLRLAAILETYFKG